MKVLTKSNLENLIQGSSLLGTGGGGTTKTAKKIANKLSSRPLLGYFNDFKPNDLCVTVFGVGGIEKCDPIISSRKAFSVFESLFRKKIKGIIPVEIGPLATIISIYISSELQIPVLNADIVGGRSSPEIYLETITLSNLSRLPCVLADDKNNVIVLKNTQSEKMSEKLMRNFAVACGGITYVVGYPLTINQLSKIAGNNTVSESITIGSSLNKLRTKTLSIANFCNNHSFTLIDTGTIVKTSISVDNGFTVGKYKIQADNSSKNVYQIMIKNENIVLLKSNEVLVTVPDLICLLDLNTYIGVNNFESNKGKKVVILVKKALPIWRTPEGIKLFSPKNIGLQYPQKLLQ